MIASLASVLRPAARSILWLDRGHRLHPLSERVREKETAFDRIVLGCIDAFRRATTEPLLVARAPICPAAMSRKARPWAMSCRRRPPSCGWW